MCLPHIDSPSIFGALLDDKKGGRFSVSPVDDWDSTAEYIPGTNILQTKLRTRTGVMQITDFMPVSASGREEFEEEGPELNRLMEIRKGEVNVRVTFDPRFDYARGDTRLKKHDKGIIAEGNNEYLTLSCSREINIPDDIRMDDWTLSEGDRVWLQLRYGNSAPVNLDSEKAE